MHFRFLILVVVVAMVWAVGQAQAQDIPSFRQATSAELRARVPLMVPLLVSSDSTKEKLALRMVLLAGGSYIAMFSNVEQLAMAARSLNPADQMIQIDRGALCDGLNPQSLLVLDLGSRDSLVTNGSVFCEVFREDRDRIRKMKQEHQSAPNHALEPTRVSRATARWRAVQRER